MKIIIAIVLLMFVAGSVLAAIPKGFEAYDTWPRLPCMDLTIEGRVYHLHAYDKNDDGYPDAVELYAEPNYVDPTFYAFDLDGDGIFTANETFDVQEIEEERW